MWTGVRPSLGGSSRDGHKCQIITLANTNILQVNFDSHVLSGILLRHP